MTLPAASRAVPGPSRTIRIHYRRPPDRMRVYVQELVHDDGRVKITLSRSMSLDRPLRIGGSTVLEDGSDVVWFTFPGSWHDIGRFHRADGTLTGIYANVLTPCVFEPGGEWYTTDLCLDLWVPAEGGGGRLRRPGLRPRLLDEEELERAETEGWVDRATARRARAEAAHLVEVAEAGRWPPSVVEAWPLSRARGEGGG